MNHCECVLKHGEEALKATSSRHSTAAAAATPRTRHDVTERRETQQRLSDIKTLPQTLIDAEEIKLTDKWS